MEWLVREPDRIELSRLLSAPIPLDNKYSRGVLGVIAGSESYAGAALLNVSAAIRTGAGMVRFLGDSRLARSILIERPEVVFNPGEVACYLIGSGIDPAQLTQVVKDSINMAFESKLPVVVDAGGLRFARTNRKFQLLTPHSGELARLLSSIKIEVSTPQISAAPLQYAQFAAETLGCDVLLKGNTTVIASYSQGLCYQISNLNSWLATAGSGDVLAGIIAGLVVQQQNLSELDFLNCAALGVIIHSRAADLASIGGPIAANDLPQLIPRVVAELMNN